MNRLAQVGMVILLLGLFVLFAYFDPFSLLSSTDRELNSVLVLQPPSGATVWNSDALIKPSVIYDEANDLYKMWYISESDLDVGSVGYTTSTDARVWDINLVTDPIFEPGDGWEVGGITGVSVTLENGTYHMWYSAKQNREKDSKQSIGYATSTNGTRWTRHASNPMVIPRIGEDAWYNLLVTEPTVVRVGNAWQMWFAGLGTDDDQYRIGHATSGNGSTWSVDPEPVIVAQESWEKNGVRSPNVTRSGTNLLEMWYTGVGARNHMSLGRSLSNDGVYWVPFEENPILSDGKDSVAHASALQYFDEVIVFFTRSAGRKSDEMIHQVRIPNISAHNAVDLFR